MPRAFVDPRGPAGPCHITISSIFPASQVRDMTIKGRQQRNTFNAQHHRFRLFSVSRWKPYTRALKHVNATSHNNKTDAELEERNKTASGMCQYLVEKRKKKRFKLLTWCKSGTGKSRYPGVNVWIGCTPSFGTRSPFSWSMSMKSHPLRLVRRTREHSHRVGFTEMGRPRPFTHAPLNTAPSKSL